MDEYKKKPLKIAVNALTNKAYEVGTVVMNAFPSASPFLQFALSGFGAYLAYKQEELNDFTKYLMDNKEKLGIDFDSKEFQEGVFVQLETYLKLRVKDKKFVAQEIFKSFCGSPNKPNFPLERYNDTLLKISEEGLQYLVFLQKEILPLRDAAIEKRYDEGNFPTPPEGKSKDWWVEHYKNIESISDYVSQWVSEFYPLTVNVDQVEAGKEEYRQEEVAKKRDDLSNLSLEMEQLAIMHSYSASGGLSWGGSAMKFTPYGLKFIEFIPKLTN